MTRSKFTEAQVCVHFARAEDGTRVEEVCRNAGVSQATAYSLQLSYGGLMPPGMRLPKQLEEESGRLKRTVPDRSRDNEILQDALRRKL